MWRSRLALGAGAVLAIVFIVGIDSWEKHEPLAATAVGAVETEGVALAVRDRWTFHKVRSEGTAREAFVGLTIPVFAADDSADASRARLECDGEGKPLAIEYETGPDRPMAFVCRSITGPGPRRAGPAAPGSPLGMLVRPLYPGQTVEGFYAPTAAGDRDREWPTVRLSAP
jgi:hypothetical protein